MSNEAYTESWLVGPRSTNFYTRTYLPPSQTKLLAAIIFVHGFAEHIGRYTTYHPLFSARGIAVFAYDQRGFGLTAQDTMGHKSRTSSYGKTSWVEQMEDLQWAIEHAKTTFQDVPLFLMGHSMGGGEVLGFACQGHAESLKYLSGIISTSPLIRQTHPSSKILVSVGGFLSKVAPTFLVPAEVNPQALSHDPVVYEAYESDPLVKMKGSLKGIHDMLTKGDWLLRSAFLQWPNGIPVLMAHGTADQVTDHDASKRFCSHLNEGLSKKIFLFEGCHHELHNEPDGVREKLVDIIFAFVQEHAGGQNLAETSDTPPKTEELVETAFGSSGSGTAKAKM